MNQTDRAKIILAGFTIIRTCEVYIVDQQRPYISTTYNGYTWVTLEGPFESKRSRDHRMQRLLLDDKVIED